MNRKEGKCNGYDGEDFLRADKTLEIIHIAPSITEIPQNNIEVTYK